MSADAASSITAGRASVWRAAARRISGTGWFVIAMVLLSLGLRLAFLYYAREIKHAEWTDPDHYLSQARALTRAGFWQWTIDATTYVWGKGEPYTLPAGYPVFLSIFFHAPGYSLLAAALAQIVIGSAAAAGMYWIAAWLHSERAGRIACAIYAVWLPGPTGANVFVGEQLAIPLLVAAFAALAWCVAARASWWAYAGAGALWAASSLVRALPWYFAPVAVVLLVVQPNVRRVPLRSLGAWLAGVLVPTLLYSAVISHERGYLVLIDNHGAIDRSETSSGHSVRITDSIAVLARDAAANVGAEFERARGMWNVTGPGWLFNNTPTATPAVARVTEWVVHLWLDGLWVVVAIIAPIGLALARRRELALVLGVWILYVVGVSALSGMTGPRYRAPAEIALMCGAAVMLSGAWPKASRVQLGVGGLAAAGIAMILLPQVPRALSARAAFNHTAWPPDNAPDHNTMTAVDHTGFHAQPVNGVIVFSCEPIDDAGPVEFVVRVGGFISQPVAGALAHPAEFRLASTERLAFVEVTASRPDHAARIWYRVKRGE